MSPPLKNVDWIQEMGRMEDHGKLLFCYIRMLKHKRVERKRGFVNILFTKIRLNFFLKSKFFIHKNFSTLNNKEFLCITHTVEHNYISPSSTVCIQLHVSALYVGHLQVVI